MASNLSVCVLLICLYAGESYGDIQRYFPLKNCSGVELDILGFVDYDLLIWQDHVASLRDLFAYFARQAGSRKLSKLRVVTVLAKSYTGIADDYSNWHFRNVFHNIIYFDGASITPHYLIRDTKILIDMKTQYVERLFKEMRGVRKTAIHIAIMFLDGADFTQEEIINLPSFVQQRNADIKIFVVIVGNKFAKEIVYLNDTIVLPSVWHASTAQLLLMAMCRQCFKGWVSGVQLTLGAHVHSCYRFNRHEKMGWSNAMIRCNTLYGGFLARVETEEEFTFVQTLLRKTIKYHMTSVGSYKQAAVFIGLRRDYSSHAKRFHWYTHSGEYLPLVTKHWLPGKPSNGAGIYDCGLWQFNGVWNNSQQAYVADYFSEGWRDVTCHEHRSMSLCEVVLQQQTGINNIISVTVSPRENFTAALDKGDFLAFEDNIISVYENVGNRDVLRSFRKSTNECPMFDCVEDTGQRRMSIPYSLICDNVYHCSNKRDEAYCFHSVTSYSPSDRHCASGKRCYDGSCVPIKWLNDGEVDCKIIGDEKTDEDPAHNVILKDYKTCALICNYNICIATSQLHDGVNDCTGPDGALDETIGKLKSVNVCTNRMSDIMWAPKCVYIKDMYGGVIGCRDMSHLKDCKGFQCDLGYVKCYNSYCIPQHYLLDNTADCPTGEDEHPFNIGRCTRNFACWDSNVCLHLDFVCDGHSDCPHKDDELNCKTLCPEGFRCTAGAVIVLNNSFPSPVKVNNFASIDTRTRYLDLSGIDLSQIEDFFHQITSRCIYVVVLILSRCNITYINLPVDETVLQHYQVNIQRLDISYNMIKEIFSTEVVIYSLALIHNLNASYNKRLVSLKHLQFSFLKILDLSHTGLSYLPESVFAGLPALKHLNLSYSLISEFNRKYFPAGFTLHTLDLRGLISKHYVADLFHDVAITQNLYADHYQVCCPKVRGPNIPPHTCHSPTDAISSCFDLIGLFVQRVLLWMVAVISVAGNMAVIVFRVIWGRPVLKTGYGLFVTNLGVSDFVMGIYLFIIAGADLFYRDNYVLYEKNWRASVACDVAGFLATLSHETSTFFTFLITLDRYLVINFPFRPKHFSRIPKIVTIILVWVLGIVLSLIPILLNFNIYSSNAMCLGLPLTNTQVKGWGYSVGVFVIFNFFMFLFIACGQCAIFRAMSENRMSKTATSMSRSRRAEDITVAKQLSLIVLSNFLCWFPVGLMGLLSLGGHEVSSEVYAWTTVLLLPINSAVNPVLYTIPALVACWEKFKYG